MKTKEKGTWIMDIGDRIKKAREKQHLSQKELAAKLGITPTVISNYETNRKNDPRASTIRKIADVLDVSADYLLNIENLAEEENEQHQEALNLTKKIDNLPKGKREQIYLTIDNLLNLLQDTDEKQHQEEKKKQ